MSAKGKGANKTAGDLNALYFAKVFDRLSVAYTGGAELELELPSPSGDPPKSDARCALQSQIASVRLRRAIDERFAAQQRASEFIEALERNYREMSRQGHVDITDAFTPAQVEPNESRLHIRNAERDHAEAAWRPKPRRREVDWGSMREEYARKLKLSEQKGKERAKRRQEEMARRIRAAEPQARAT
jgi:hypothetical protein